MKSSTSIFLLSWLALLLLPRSVLGQDPTVPVPAQAPEAGPGQPPSADPPLETALRDRIDGRARLVELLVRSELPETEDTGSLLRISYKQGSIWRAEDVVALIAAVSSARERESERSAKSKKRRPKRAPPAAIDPSPDLQSARQRLITAYAEYLALPAERQAELLQAHAAKRAAAAQEAGRADALRTRLAQIEERAGRLAQFLEGDLPLEVDPNRLLEIDLVADAGLFNLPTSPELTAEDPEPAVADPPADLPPSEAAQLEAEVAAAEASLVARRLELIELAPQARQSLLDRHFQRRDDAAKAAAAAAEAEDQENTEAQEAISDAHAEAAAAAAEREQALLAASKARSEAKRLVAEEHARLLGVKQAHALFEAELNSRREAASEGHERALEWKRKVGEQTALIGKNQDPSVDPDEMYEPLRQDLSAARKRLAALLAEIRQAHSGVPEVGAAPEELSPSLQSDELVALRSELQASLAELQEAERALRWELAGGYRNDIVLLNRTRLALLEITSSELRSRVTGFGPDGVGQARREALQIGLELQYHALSLPRHADQVLDDVKRSPIPLLGWILKVGFAFVVFRWWRRRADELLKRIREAWEGKSPRTPFTRMVATAAYYLARIRKPLEWLALAAVFFYAASGLEAFPELSLIWIVLLWLLVGSAIIFFVDAIAARDGGRRGTASSTATLRLRSLKLIGLVIVYTGLVLSLADELVGRGAIYAWVLKTVWFLAIPIYLLLLTWWKPHIFAVFAHEPPSGFVAWVNDRKKGFGSYVAASAAGFYLFGRGIVRWGMRRASAFEATKRVLAYLFRREVAKQAEATSTDESVNPIAEELRVRIAAPEVEVDRMAKVAGESLEEVLEVVKTARSTITAVVAERGLGKSTFLRRLEARLPNQGIIVSCPDAGYGGLLGRLSEGLGIAAPATEAAVVAELRRRGPVAILIDDAQRLVRPAIGGLKGLDQLGALARQADGQVSWVVGIGASAWQYINRARGDRLFFDQVVNLRPWTEEQIGEFLRLRTEAVGLDPSFEGLVVPRQYDETGSDAEDRSEAGFYRILWDYANGNPYVASYFWARSLFLRDDGTTVVRLFVEPSAAELDDLALPLHFILRALVQLETATTDELMTATRLNQPEVEDAIRFLRARGYLEDDVLKQRIHREWFRAISNMLRRQHLLAA